MEDRGLEVRRRDDADTAGTDGDASKDKAAT
jgi:hypothetical protein